MKATTNLLVNLSQCINIITYIYAPEIYSVVRKKKKKKKKGRKKERKKERRKKGREEKEEAGVFRKTTITK